MQKVKCYVDEMLQELPKSKRAKELKAEILANMEERYQELAEQNKEQDEIENQLISEIGTAAEIRKNINLTNKTKQVVVVGLELFIFFVAVGYISYVKLNEHIFRSTFEIYQIVIANVVAFPLAIFFGTVLALNIVNYLIRPKEIFRPRKGLRIASLTASITLMLLYCLFTLHALGIYMIMPAHLVFFIGRYINIIAGFTGILFYLGKKK